LVDFLFFCSTRLYFGQYPAKVKPNFLKKFLHTDMKTRLTLGDYQIISDIYQGSRTVVHRAIRKHDQRSVIIKRHSNEYPSFNELIKFRNQYTIAKNLNLAGVVSPLALENHGNSYLLVMPDEGYVSLQSLVGDQQPEGYLRSNLAEFLQIAVQITDILHGLYENRVIHKDIKPANIIIHPETKQVKLIDFSIASLLSKEHQETWNPHVLEGTLAYMSPEQTGRMNRGVDYRTDFYALGVTFYELLSGRLPFEANDPIELVHCHLAQQPQALDPEAVPPVLNDLVFKLMAKNADERYQSALGIKHDLQECLGQWQQNRTIVHFSIAQADRSDRFLVPETLYGRSAEIANLLAAFDRVSTGHSEMILVAGFSGIGKTAVVNEVHKPIVRQRGYFIKGKFDQFNRNIPFLALVQALRSLMAQILSESDGQLEQWRRKILTALGENGQVIIEVIPELEHIIGNQPPVQELTGSASQNRFNRLFSQFIRVFATTEHPLVMFLDDLQWADAASLNLIKLLMSESVGAALLMIGAYRDNEVYPVHPLMLTIDELKKIDTAIDTITLAPLTLSDINHLVAETLNCSRQMALPLTELIYQKTEGNPFFTTQFLTGLHREGLIRFDLHTGQWQCDIDQVRKLSLTDDVVEFMATQLQKLPSPTQDMLKLAACVGNRFDLTTLSLITNRAQVNIADALWPALQEGLIIPGTETYKYFQELTEQVDRDQSDLNVPYRFLHDRIQQASYYLIPPEQRQAAHLRIGKLLLRNTPENEREERLFEIVNHLNMGRALIEQAAEQEQLAKLNLNAGKKAKAATAYSAAVDYFSTGIELLPDGAWQSRYDLALTLYTNAAEAACLNLDYVQMEQRANAVLQNVRHLLDTIPVQQTCITAARFQGQNQEAIDIGLQTLKQLEVRLPSQPTKADVGQALATTAELLQGREPQSLINLPTMSDAEQLAIMDILNQLVPCAYTVNPTLMALIILKQVEFSLQHGNCPVSIYSYVDYGLILCGIVGDINTGYEFGQLALNLLDHFQAKPFESRTKYVVYTYINHWKDSLHASPPKLSEAYQAGLETGDLEAAGLNAAAYCYYSFDAGKTLSELEEDCAAYAQALDQFKQSNSHQFLNIHYQLVLNLLGQSEMIDQLTGTVFDAAESLPQYVAENRYSALFTFHLCQLMLSFLFGKDQEAAAQSPLAEQYIDGGLSTFMVPLYAWYDALVHLSLYNDASAEKQQQILERVAMQQQKLQTWANFAPTNHQHRWNLVEAMRQAVLGNRTEAIEHFDLALTQAKESGFGQDEALVNELTARFYLDWHKETVAAGYMQEAYYGYARWGAKAKTDDLEVRYPQLLVPILQSKQTLADMSGTFSWNPSPLMTSSSSSSTFSPIDLTTILKASQAISEEIDLKHLILTFLSIITENAGADRAAFILHQDDQLIVTAQCHGIKKCELQSIPIDTCIEVPTSLINYVNRTKEIIILSDAHTDTRFGADEYLSTTKPKSLLCMPILYQGKLTSILYLENNLTIDAFPLQRVETLKLLCSQAAISLENAWLYQQSQNYSQKLEESLQHLQQAQLQLVQSEKMSALGNLVAGVAHEINNPVGFLKGNIAPAKDYVRDLFGLLEMYQNKFPKPGEEIEAEIEAIDLEFLQEDLPKLLNSMNLGVERIKNISTSLRTFSRADKDYKTAFNLHEGLDSTILILKHRLKENQDRPAIEIIKNYGELPTVDCFPGQLNQVFMNVISNAIDALDEGNKDLTFAEIAANPNQITIQSEATEDGMSVIVRIRDNGPGMSKAIRQQIFDHLFTTKCVGKGTGLGLSIAKQIVEEKHGGKLSCMSELGKGTEFVIEIPIK
jgi:predicted ATPase/signal transduction histidine kinase/tRNA A-37 threonylcarbamoyl transferase component Bud32